MVNERGKPGMGLNCSDKANSGLIRFLSANTVPVLFIMLCLLGIYFSRLPIPFLINEIITRLSRNSFLVLSLIIPVLAGMGLNFGIVIGAMTSQAALIATTHWKLGGLGGFFLTGIIATPLAIFLGYLIGKLLNKTKGQEMIASMILGFFANGIYQFIFLFLIGSVIPLHNKDLVLETGIGIKNTVNLKYIMYSLDDLMDIKLYPGISIPLATLMVVLLLCVSINFLLKTKLGQDFRAIGQDQGVARILGINVDRTRIIAIVISTVLAAWGQLIFMQNIGTMNTYGSHEQVGTFAIASLLIGGASVKKATIGQAILGTLLFHTLFIVSPVAGKNLLGNPQVGEYFRVFIAYGVIAVSLGLNAINAQRTEKKSNKF